MNGEFVPYQVSLDMKELGFDDMCLFWFDGKNQSHTLGYNRNSESWLNGKNCSSPTFSQCFRFFRERYRLHQNITQYYGEHFYYKIEDMVHPRRFDEYPLEKLRNLGEYSSHIEAELWCLKQLIKIVKTK
jgi:hypothetical protein